MSKTRPHQINLTLTSEEFTMLEETYQAHADLYVQSGGRVREVASLTEFLRSILVDAIWAGGGPLFLERIPGCKSYAFLEHVKSKL